MEAPIFVKTETFMMWLLEHTIKFPKYERFRLARQIEDAIFNLHRHLLSAAKTQDKKIHLQAADIELDRLRAYLRLATELKYTSVGQYGYAAQQVTEIGKMLGGWLKKA